MSHNRINTSIDIDVTQGKSANVSAKTRRGNTTCSLESGDAGEYLFAKLDDTTVEIFRQCHQNKSRFIGAKAPALADFANSCSQQDIFTFCGIKKTLSDDDYSTVFSLENAEGEVSEAALSSAQSTEVDDIDFEDEDGFYFLLVKWGSVSAQPWTVNIEGEYDDAKLSLKVKRLADNFLSYDGTDKIFRIGSFEFITAIDYDLNNQSEEVTHELYSSTQPLTLENTSYALCIMQVRNHEHSIVYGYDEDSGEEQFLPLIEKATLQNPEDDPLASDTRHRLCDLMSLEDRQQSRSDFQEHDYGTDSTATGGHSSDFEELLKR